VSALSAVLAEARVGGTAENIAARLGLAPDLVDSMIDQGERLGLLGSARAACGSCASGSAAVVVGPGCARCPLARSA
jgi:hypothetical protein